MTNTEEPLFVIESMDTIFGTNFINDKSLKAIVFAVNQKGSSSGVILRNFLSNGANDARSGN